MLTVDLTPFGFTPTETSAYLALLEAGPSSGYAIAKRISVARANAYAALNGLVTKQAAQITGEAPSIYRAVQPQAVFAGIVRDTSAKLAVLERQIDSFALEAEPATVSFAGSAEFAGILLRTVVREPGPVRIVAGALELGETIPVWRTRGAHDRPSEIWSIGAAPREFPVPLAGSLAAESVRAVVGEEVLIALTPSAAILGRRGSEGPAGYWTSDPVLLSAARGTFRAITS